MIEDVESLGDGSFRQNDFVTEISRIRHTLDLLS